MALYESDAVLALPTGDVARGERAIRDAFQRMLAGRPVFTGGQRRPVVKRRPGVDLDPPAGRGDGSSRAAAARWNLAVDGRPALTPCLKLRPDESSVTEAGSPTVRLVGR